MPRRSTNCERDGFIARGHERRRAVPRRELLPLRGQRSGDSRKRGGPTSTAPSFLRAQRATVRPSGPIIHVGRISRGILPLRAVRAGAAVRVALAIRQRKSRKIEFRGRRLDVARKRRRLRNGRGSRRRFRGRHGDARSLGRNRRCGRACSDKQHDDDAKRRRRRRASRRCTRRCNIRHHHRSSFVRGTE
jgi:hypothetical protein